MTPEQKKTLDRFYGAATDQDGEVLRSLLTDGFTFKSPLVSFDNPDDYVAHLVGFCGSISESRFIAEGDRVAHTFMLNTRFPDGEATIPMCDIFTFDGDRIREQELFTDASRFPSPS